MVDKSIPNDSASLTALEPEVHGKCRRNVPSQVSVPKLAMHCCKGTATPLVIVRMRCPRLARPLNKTWIAKRLRSDFDDEYH
jgi:hypothetical protein